METRTWRLRVGLAALVLGCAATPLASQTGKPRKPADTQRSAAGPAAPEAVRAVAGTQRVELYWNASPGATGYNVYRGAGAGGVGVLPYRSGVTATSIADTALADGTYTYQVSALAGSAEGARSPPVSAQVRSAGAGCLHAHWVANRPYAAGDIVSHEGALYRARHPNPGYNPAISTYYWQPHDCQATAARAPCSFPRWTMDKPYAAGDIVTYEGAHYRAKHPNPGYNPAVSTYYWAQHSCAP